MGKTTYCKQLVNSIDEYMEINCAGLTCQPNLRPITPAVKIINFDEASVAWCLTNKKILQGPDMPVTMGDSATGCHSYKVELNGLLMVICSNTWLKELEAYDDDGPEKEYIGKNFVYYHVDKHLAGL